MDDVKGDKLANIKGKLHAKKNKGSLEPPLVYRETRPQCETVFDEVWEEACQTVYKEACHMKTVPKCWTVSARECGPRSEEKCSVVFEHKCTKIPIPFCNVEWEKRCSNEPVCAKQKENVCVPAEKEICVELHDKKCTMITEKVCLKRAVPIKPIVLVDRAVPLPVPWFAKSGKNKKEKGDKGEISSSSLLAFL